jgi:hypothetical protein
MVILGDGDLRFGKCVGPTKVSEDMLPPFSGQTSGQDIEIFWDLMIWGLVNVWVILKFRRNILYPLSG